MTTRYYCVIIPISIQYYIMKHPVLNAEPRKVLGKKVKKLRREGIIPANVYGKGLSSISIQVSLPEFQTVHKEVGETGLVSLKVEGKSLPVLVKNLQINYTSNTLLHVDFYKVNLKEKVKAMVPVEIVGEAKAVTEKIGDLIHAISEIEVEALPDRIPESVQVNVEGLAEIGDGVNVGDLKLEEGIEVLTDPGITVVKIAELAKEEPVETPEEEGTEEGESAGEVKPTEGSEDKKETETAETPQEK